MVVVSGDKGKIIAPDKAVKEGYRLLVAGLREKPSLLFESKSVFRLLAIPVQSKIDNNRPTRAPYTYGNGESSNGKPCFKGRGSKKWCK
ncbi:hypothetical protein TorRG33x02_303120, partial [Trema orientale]